MRTRTYVCPRPLLALLAVMAGLGIATQSLALATPLGVNRVAIWSNGDKAGRLIARGEADVMSLPLDLSAGMVVTITDSATYQLAVEFEASDCSASGPSRTLCRKIVAPGKRQRVKIRNTGDGQVRIYFQGLDVEGPLTGPVSVSIETASDLLTGVSDPCIGGPRLLFCR